eukprot:TRINITY_DN6370_c0_g2_i1.p1 TRINITY_DN6370_c0_g2~~TRINITY_DN6370_c0_g2_i1.p1  ORF type:complete len:104 (+),score=12.39 TRINITY_DN6370_c0_g2_i1:170-481(+)
MNNKPSLTDFVFVQTSQLQLRRSHGAECFFLQFSVCQETIVKFLETLETLFLISWHVASTRPASGFAIGSFFSKLQRRRGHVICTRWRSSGFIDDVGRWIFLF